MIVAEGATLTIEPGVEVKFAAGRDDSEGGSDTSLSELIIYGGLRAIGTPTKRINFTSNADYPAAGDWGGIYWNISWDDKNPIFRQISMKDAQPMNCPHKAPETLSH